MDQYLDNRHKEILANLLANPADIGRANVATLQRLADEYPQSGVLQVLLARAGETPNVTKAAAYLKPVALYKLLHNPESLQEVRPSQIVNNTPIDAERYFSTPVPAMAEEPDGEEKDHARVPFNEPNLSAQTIGYAPQASHEPDTVIVPAEAETDLPTPVEQDDEKALSTVQTEEPEQPAETETTQPEPAAEQPQTATEIEDEVHDEIQDTSHVIPELYNAYTEQLAHPENNEQPAEVLKEQPGTIIPELYNSYEEQLENPQTDEHPADAPAEEPGEIIPELYNSYEDQVAEQKEELPQPVTEEAEQQPVAAAEQHESKPVSAADDIEDEVYDEIVGIDQIGFAQTVNVLHESVLPETVTPENEGAWQNTFSDDEEYPEDEEEKDERPLQQSAGITDADVNIDEEKLILGNIVSADYLMFDKKLDELRSGEKVPPAGEPAPVEPAAEAEPAKEPETVSRYNDDTMPYSFMWWLDKTRKEHAGQFQPYVTNPAAHQAPVPNDGANAQQRVKPVKRKAPDELQQQYYENIFSSTSVNGIEGEGSKGLEFDHNKKEDVIIERFITTEPQMRPPAADKLDNENKAKKSSEDQDALVTETLARIYTDQMLYHKAIATYKKLILKFPEKKLYFAAQIEQLEKKTN